MWDYYNDEINKLEVIMKKTVLFLLFAFTSISLPQIKAHWTFTEMSGTTLNDRSGNGNNGQIIGATWQNTNGLRQLSFNGNNNYVSVPHSPSLNFGTGNFTYEIQFKTSVIPTFSWTGLISKHNTANWHDREIFLGIEGNTGLPFISLSDGNGYFETAKGTTNVCDGIFHIVRGVRQGSQLKIYVDGNLQATVSASINPDSNNPLNIGRSSYNNGQGYFNGVISDISIWNLGSPITSIENNYTNIPTGYELFNNYPNPFNPTTKISYSVPQLSFVSLKVFDSLGKEVAELVNGEKYPGSFEVNFNASNLPSGVYFYRLTAGNFSQTKKLILMK